ncbi:MAG: hypothetical protein Q4G03_00495 [Planctomycetia bacterium]|nr:hypothetical protein [Planctomycetia bacterium]
MANEAKYELVNSLESTPTTITQHVDQTTELTDLVRQLIMVQSRQNDLLQEVVNQLSAAQKQRVRELAQWRRANPALAKSCKLASDCLGKLQTDMLSSLTYDLDVNYEAMQENEYMTSEFFEKYGPRIVHMNALLQTLSVLGNAPESPNFSGN